MINNFIKCELKIEQTIFLRTIARKNWAFFKTFVAKDDNWLPIDNYQEHPIPKTAHRTSPTNIGFGLLAILAAYDFGYITSARLIELIMNTFTTMSLLERHRGHFYNWYDTQSLKALKPMYVSTVDSGNLSACLFAVRVALRALPDKTIIDQRVFTGLQDTLRILDECIAGIADHTNVGHASRTSVLAEFQTTVQSACHSAPTLIEARSCLKRMTKCARKLLDSVDDTAFSVAHWWAQALYGECSDALAEIDFLLPWISLLPVSDKSVSDKNGQIEELDKMLTMRHLANLESSSIALMSKQLLGPVFSNTSDGCLNNLEELITVSSQRARAALVAIEKLTYLSSEFAHMEFGFLYDKARRLLATGYNQSEKNLDSARYDLLASEARLSYFIAIAQGQIPKECWFKLRRDLSTVDGQGVLLSWNGSMLEYLMPLLVMPAYDHTLLNQTYQSAVKRQIQYGNERGVPWGASASSYNSIDDDHNYRYAAFGVPGLGLKHGLADDLVIAPHATALALMVAPAEALKNLKRLSCHGFIGKYGFYDAIDYTPERVPAGESHVIVRSFMAHHQGMTLLSISKLVLESPMQELFEGEPEFNAIISLLQEPVSIVGQSHHRQCGRIC